MRLLTTRDGRSLEVAHYGHSHKEALRAFGDGLSDRSRHLFTPHRYDDATLTELAARNERGEDLTLIALEGERIVGYYFLWYTKRPVALLGIGFADEFQSQGLGRQAMAQLVEAGRELGLDGIELTTDLTNDRAYALYQSFGFRYLRDVKNVVGDGSIRIERAMFLALKDGAEPMQEEHAPPV